MKGLKGKGVIVTGASSGIGQAIAIRLAAEGCHVAINYRGDLEGAQATEADAKKAAEAAGHDVKTLLVQADVSKEDNILAMVEKTTQAWGGFDVLVNNAGVQKEVESHELTADGYDKVVGVNLRGAFLCAREAVQHFLQQQRRGVIINVSSVHEIVPRPL